MIRSNAFWVQYSTQRRGPTQVVCFRCRRLKTKCNRQRPCRKCERDRKPCTYFDNITRPSHTKDIEQSISMPSSSSADNIKSARCSPGGQFPDIVSTSFVSDLRRWVVDDPCLGWYGPLLRMIGHKDIEGHKVLFRLLEQASKVLIIHHWFDLVNVNKLTLLLEDDQTRKTVCPALVCALIALALSARQSPADLNTILPDRITSATCIKALAEQIKGIAKTHFFHRTSGLGDQDAFPVASLLQLVQSAAILALLEEDFSVPQERFIQFVMQCIRFAPPFQQMREQNIASPHALHFNKTLLVKDWPKSQSRTSTYLEETARIFLFPQWWFCRLGAFS